MGQREGNGGTEELRLRLRVDALEEVILELGLDTGHNRPPFIFPLVKYDAASPGNMKPHRSTF